MHLIIQVTAGDDSVDLWNPQPLALQRQGEVVYKAFRKPVPTKRFTLSRI